MNFCSIASGSSGNCIFAGTEHTSILIDAGISGKKVAEGLKELDRKPEELDAILITHEHSDHIKGLGVLARKYGIPVYSAPGTIRAMLESNALGKVDASLFHEIHADESFHINEMEIQPFRVSHDAAEPVAYRVNCQEKSVAVATDLGYYDEYTVEHLKGLDAVLIESNHDINMLQVGTYPYYLKQRILGSRGHLSNENAGRLIGEILHDGLKAVMLGHLSKENNYEALAFATVCAEITMGDNPYRAEDFPIAIARRDVPSQMIAV
ncbi:MAG: MBL fold metallo-hydrolase [Lachnospiraceae bacterium]|nr:MBL fold metallo-hydrolase [Lachnospiraceae bacterium]